VAVRRGGWLRGGEMKRGADPDSAMEKRGGERKKGGGSGTGGAT
jgi:hypothetical protein